VWWGRQRPPIALCRLRKGLSHFSAAGQPFGSASDEVIDEVEENDAEVGQSSCGG
jgi:hypothetical protein